MTMPGDVTFNSGDSYFGGNLTEYVRNGTIPEARVDDMGKRFDLVKWRTLIQLLSYSYSGWMVFPPAGRIKFPFNQL